MKKLSDYKGEEAILLWGDLLELFTKILGNETVAASFRAKKPKILLAKDILTATPKEAEALLLRIDDTALDGLNMITRLVSILNEIGEDPEMQAFFGLSAEAKKPETFSGSATVNTEASENPDTSSNM